MKKQIILTTALAALFPLAAFAQSPNATAVRAPGDQSIPSVPAGPSSTACSAAAGDICTNMTSARKSRSLFSELRRPKSRACFRSRWDLPRGFGVVVDYVVPNGPAAAAGLQASDIIRMLNDQQIVDPSQLGKLVRSFAEGTSVDLTLLRKGKEVKLSVKLGKKDVPVGRGPFGFEQEWNFDDLDKMKFDFKAPDMTRGPRSGRAGQGPGDAGAG